MIAAWSMTTGIDAVFAVVNRPCPAGGDGNRHHQPAAHGPASPLSIYCVKYPLLAGAVAGAFQPCSGCGCSAADLLTHLCRSQDRLFIILLSLYGFVFWRGPLRHSDPHCEGAIFEEQPTILLTLGYCYLP